jgi:hypothetical protein
LRQERLAAAPPIVTRNPQKRFFLSTGKLGPVFATDRARRAKALETHAMRPFKRTVAAAQG